MSIEYTFSEAYDGTLEYTFSEAYDGTADKTVDETVDETVEYTFSEAYDGVEVKKPLVINVEKLQKIDVEELKENGPIKVVFRRGEAYGSKIRWEILHRGVLIYQEQCNPNNEPGIAIKDAGCGYAGFHERTKTYWRYKDQGRYGAGEHCMQVVYYVL